MGADPVVNWLAATVRSLQQRVRDLEQKVSCEEKQMKTQDTHAKEDSIQIAPTTITLHELLFEKLAFNAEAPEFVPAVALGPRSYYESEAATSEMRQEAAMKIQHFWRRCGQAGARRQVLLPEQLDENSMPAQSRGFKAEVDETHSNFRQECREQGVNEWEFVCFLCSKRLKGFAGMRRTDDTWEQKALVDMVGDRPSHPVSCLKCLDDFGNDLTKIMEDTKVQPKGASPAPSQSSIHDEEEYTDEEAESLANSAVLSVVHGFRCYQVWQILSPDEASVCEAMQGISDLAVHELLHTVVAQASSKITKMHTEFKVKHLIHLAARCVSQTWCGAGFENLWDPGSPEECAKLEDALADCVKEAAERVISTLESKSAT